jgi:P2 family phage contractile tail tube protein
MAQHPELLVNFEVYEGGKNFMGIAECTLPNIQFVTQNIHGAGIGGNLDAVANGMVNAMNFTMKFRSSTVAAVDLFAPQKHEITLMVAEQSWDTNMIDKVTASDKYVLVIVPKNYNPGNVVPATTPDSQNEFSVYYYAGYRDGKQLFEIDPANMICKINGQDYLAPVRKAVGK